LIPDMVSGIPMDQVIGLPFFHFSHWKVTPSSPGVVEAVKAALTTFSSRDGGKLSPWILKYDMIHIWKYMIQYGMIHI
jgi:hypothetical protein